MVSAALLGLVGCGQPDPLWVARSVSRQQASAMVGKDYIITAQLTVCRDRSDVFMGNTSIKRPKADAPAASCNYFYAGRFRVVEAGTARSNDPRTILHIVGPGIDGYIPYESFLPMAYKEAGAYFGTR